MEKMELFRGTVMALMRGPFTVDQISRFTGQPSRFVRRELDRLRQCVDEWIVFDMRNKTYSFNGDIKMKGHREIVSEIRRRFEEKKHTMDLRMDLRGKANPVSYDMDYNQLDKYIKRKAKVTITFDFSDIPL